MFNWLREILEIKYEFRERRARLWKEQQMGSFEIEKDKEICESCETLRQQLEISNYEKSQLLAKLLKEPEPVMERTEVPVMINKPKMVPWAVRRQLLEKEDREKARLMREVPKPSIAVVTNEKESTAELEKELDIASTEREGQK